jgi:hypothetical protein
MKTVYGAALIALEPCAIGVEGNEVCERGIGIVPHDEDEEI